MFDLVIESIAIYHLPVTVLFGMCLLFWIGVILGALDIDVFDFDVDADVDIDLDADGATEGAAESSLGALGILLKFVNAHAVPTMIVATVFSISMWAMALLLNAFLNPGEPFHRSLPIAAALIVPNLFASLYITRIVTSPMKGFFEKLSYSGEKHVPVVGRSGNVKTASISEKFGQVEVVTDGAPLLIEARVAEGGKELSKGDEVLIVDFNSETGIYSVRPS